MDLNEFDDIRPYTDSELNGILNKLLSDPSFIAFANNTLGQTTMQQLTANKDRLNSIQMFQAVAVNPFLDKILLKLAESFTSDGVRQSLADNGCLYMSNHRDIVVDVALLDKILLDHGYPTVEIGIGDNLLIYPWIKDLVRINRAFIVRRGETGKELLMQSRHLSEYIHFTICRNHHSVWIAQREGRAKDSNDRTQESVLKMLAMGSEKPFLESLRELNIHPLTISYEYDPCDYLKAKEFQQKRDNPEFKKSQADDLINMKTGIMGYKGKIHYHCAESINSQIDRIAQLSGNRNVQASLLAQTIDKQIHANYSIYPINYIALDMLNKSNQFADKYSRQEYLNFAGYIEQQIDKIDLPDKDTDCLQDYMLKIYANPLINHLAAIK